MGLNAIGKACSGFGASDGLQVQHAMEWLSESCLVCIHRRPEHSRSCKILFKCGEALVDFTIRAVHQTHMRRSALAPQSFAALAGITEQLQTQNVSEGNYLVHTSIFSHGFQTYTGKGVCVYLDCLIGDQRLLFFYARYSRRNPLPFEALIVFSVSQHSNNMR